MNAWRLFVLATFATVPALGLYRVCTERAGARAGFGTVVAVVAFAGLVLTLERGTRGTV